MNDKLIEKLAKIKRQAEGAKAIGSEHEAEAFAQMLQNLLLQHKLEMSDLDYEKEMAEEPIVNDLPKTEGKFNGEKYVRFYADAPDVEIISRKQDWVVLLADVIGKFNSCQALHSGASSIVWFVGHKTNVAISEFLFFTMLRSAMSMSKKAAMKFRREEREKNGGAGNTQPGFRDSWLAGFITRLQQRLEEERNKFDSSGMALVRVNKEALAVADFIGKMKNLKTVTSRMPAAHNSAGYYAGKKAADEMNIKPKAFEGGKPNAQLAD